MLAMDGDSGVWVGVGTALGMVIAAIAAAIVTVLKGRATNWAVMFDRQEKRITLLEANSEQAAHAVRQSNEAHAECLVRYESLWGFLVRLREYAVRLRSDGDPGPVPDLPHRDDDPDAERAAAEFRERTVLHDTAVLKKLDQRSQQPEPHP
jgi:hypothetical protein